MDAKCKQPAKTVIVAADAALETRMNTSAGLCEKCGQELKPGQWPWCPHERGVHYGWFFR